MTRQLAEVGKKISAVNQAKLRAVLEALSTLLDSDENGQEEGMKEAVLKIGPVQTMADVKKAMNLLIAYIPNATTREQMEGDGDGDEDAEALISGTEGTPLTAAESRRLADVMDKLQEAVLSTADRKQLSKSDFAIPEKAPGSGSYPIHDESHARDALARSSGKPEESRVRAAVKRKYPDIEVKESQNVGQWNLLEAATAHSHDGDDDYGNFEAMSAVAQRDHMVKAHGVSEDSPSFRKPNQRAMRHAADHGSMMESAREDVDIDSDVIALREKSISADGTVQLKLIAPGWGTSGHYTKNVLEKYGPAAFPKGMQMFLDHPTVTEERDRPERSVRDLAVVTEDAARYVESGPDGPGLYTTGRPISKEHAEVLENLAPHIGVSIRASGRATRGEVDGKKGLIIESISPDGNADFVTMPGAGGKILPLWESAKQRLRDRGTAKEDTDDVSEEQLKEAQRRIRELTDENARLRERIVMREAYDLATDELSKIDEFPAMTVKRLAESLARDPALDEDGLLDRKAFRQKIREGARDEAKYIQSLRETGRVRGMGRSNDDWESEEEEDIFSESRRRDDDDDAGSGFEKAMFGEFSKLGLDEGVARAAAAGRR